MTSAKSDSSDCLLASSLSLFFPPPPPKTNMRNSRRIATDIRLDLPVQYENLAYYRADRPLQVEDYERLRASREISWTMLTRAEIYQGTLCLETHGTLPFLFCRLGR